MKSFGIEAAILQPDVWNMKLWEERNEKRVTAKGMGGKDYLGNCRLQLIGG